MGKKTAIVLLSGGLDSATCLAVATQEGYACHCLSFDYGQKNRAELLVAPKIAEQFQASHQIISLPLAITGSALTDAQIAIPGYSDSNAIPLTYVPARNTIFLSIALGFAEMLNSQAIFIGVNAVDYSHYPDCRPDYIKAFQAMANLATKKSAEGELCTIHAPIIHLSKAEIIRLGNSLGVDYAMTVSCYRANAQGEACGSCESCVLRQQGFAKAEVADPTRYIQAR